ncbi:TPA: DNA-binding protein [Klebsiella pneumoniae]|uniref:DNA-binding protein n=1 Tax=Klebsiella pneumoniae TaxID=573 RepID=UPI00388D4F71|nr:DNA-binding protein [Klebsiella pneumoniae]HCB3696424.1 DNA-binding protein [Klebsiella pneumoniae]HCM7692905.1 DNA-binding protein [Klebsiella pneumoniae]
MITLDIEEFSMLLGIRESEIYHHIRKGIPINGVPFPKPLKQIKTHRFNYEEVMRFIEDLKGKGEL